MAKIPFTKKLIIGLVTITIVRISFSLLGLFLDYVNSGETPVRIADEYNARKLIEVYEMDANISRLQIVENNSSIWIEHPGSLGARIFDYEIRFSHDRNDMLIVNGKEFPIVETEPGFRKQKYLERMIDINLQ